MAVSTTAEIVALTLTFLVHVGGAVLLVWAMLDGSESPGRGGWRGWWPRDDDGPDDDPQPDEGGGGEIDRTPLRVGPGSGPDFEPSTARLREPGRVSDQRPRPARRPAHEPSRTPERVPR